MVRKALLRVLRRGDTQLRPWAAMALGMQMSLVPQTAGRWGVSTEAGGMKWKASGTRSLRSFIVPKSGQGCRTSRWTAPPPRISRGSKGIQPASGR